jgi:hypothetical protein
MILIFLIVMNISKTCKVPLGQKRFLLAAKTPLCWRMQHPPAILCQHKWLSLLAGVRPPPLTTVLAGDISTRQHSGFSKSARNK